MSFAVPYATRRIARLAALSATWLAVLGGVAQAASAHTTGAGTTSPAPAVLTPTQTVLTAPTDTVGPGGSVKVTATVYPGIFVTPTGGVTFTDDTTHTRLGKVSPGRKCLLLSSDPCPMSITIHAARLKPGANTITGTYSGGIAETGSSDSIVITRVKTNPTVTTTCAQGETQCQTSTDTSIDGTASASIATFGEITAPTETISLSFQTTELPCSTPDTGDALVFSSTNAPNSKIVTYTVFGTAADVANAAYGAAGNICLGSTQPFVTKGFIPPVFVDGLYYGLLPACSPDYVVPPCLEPATFTPAGEEGPPEDEYVEDAIVTAADPRMTH